VCASFPDGPDGFVVEVRDDRWHVFGDRRIAVRGEARESLVSETAQQFELEK
jgi:hypothetical protein